MNSTETNKAPESLWNEHPVVKLSYQISNYDVRLNKTKDEFLTNPNTILILELKRTAQDIKGVVHNFRVVICSDSWSANKNAVVVSPSLGCGDERRMSVLKSIQMKLDQDWSNWFRQIEFRNDTIMDNRLILDDLKQKLNPLTVKIEDDERSWPMFNVYSNEKYICTFQKVNKNEFKLETPAMDADKISKMVIALSEQNQLD